jgi:hypothetical protein
MNCANHPDRERVAFCQNCGKPLCPECSRTVGNAVFCEPCLAARLAAADAAASSSTGTPYGNVNVPNYAATAAPTPPLPGAPNPALAGLLGLIPGVGAMYNGQYAKSVVHLIIFAVLVSLSDSNGIFGLFVAGWVFYQVIEAHHTARARRDGTPLPNPFGLNDIGDRLGFGKSWPGPGAPPPVPPPPGGGAAYPPNETTHFAQDASGNTVYTQSASEAQSYTGPAASTPNWGVPPAGSYAYATPPAPPSGMPFAPIDPLLSSDRNRFPVGAILLIAFGIFFFIGSSGWFHHFPIHRIFPLLLIAMGVWAFIHRMTHTGLGIADDGSPDYRLRLFSALRGSIWIVLVGVLFFLDSFGIVSWSHSWPLFIIVAGLMMAMKRSTYTVAAPAPYSYPPAGPATPYASAQATETSTVPVIPLDEEGK